MMTCLRSISDSISDFIFSAAEKASPTASATQPVVDNFLSEQKSKPAISSLMLSRECPLPLWVPEGDCDESSFLFLDEDLPWSISDTEKVNSDDTVTRFISELEKELGLLPLNATDVDKACVIFETVRLMDWDFTKAFSGLSLKELIKTPQGNCLDVTNFTYALCQYFGIDVFFVHVKETCEGFPNHVCVGVWDEWGNIILVDPTREQGFDIQHRDWTQISEKEFLGMYYNEQGVFYEQMGNDDLALKAYQQALQYCPHRPIPLLNSAGIYMARNDFQTADMLIDAVEATGYESAQSHFIRGFYEKKMGSEERAMIEFQQTLRLCPHYQQAIQELQ